MNEVMRTVKLHLRQDLYRVPDDNDDEELDVHKDLISSDSSNEEEESSTLDSDTEEEPRCPRVKRDHIKHETKQKKEESMTKPLQVKPQDTPIQAGLKDADEQDNSNKPTNTQFG
ncbi:hypothetical protein BS47DRAFT_1391720 [Hydnum rufescens UP504]|uniref:Uncharacterized protein n=1 Tax=Hydnum rufescens UP504 TaxID=1448309 RepID=A0A9P6DXZ0_9AGAM|nr:hypothetical protein BS47DRAFT_1391720 [Hydnum rufescens UP504]